MDYSTVKKVPFKGYTRAYETMVKKLVTDPDTGKEVVKEEKIIQFGEFVEDKKKLRPVRLKVPISLPSDSLFSVQSSILPFLR